MSLTVYQDKESNFKLEPVQDVDETQVLHCKQRNLLEIKMRLEWGITLEYSIADNQLLTKKTVNSIVVIFFIGCPAAILLGYLRTLFFIKGIKPSSTTMEHGLKHIRFKPHPLYYRIIWTDYVKISIVSSPIVWSLCVLFEVKCLAYWSISAIQYTPPLWTDVSRQWGSRTHVTREQCGNEKQRWNVCFLCESQFVHYTNLLQICHFVPVSRC